MALCFGHSFFVLLHTRWSYYIRSVSVSPWYYVSWTLVTSVWPWNSISKSYFLSIWVWQDCLLFDIGVPNFDIWVHHHETTCTFLTFVWSWHLTYMWVVVGILSEFYLQFLYCSFQSFIDWRLAALTGSFFKQSIFKQLLTEGIKCNNLHNKISNQYLWSVHTMNNFHLLIFFNRWKVHHDYIWSVKLWRSR